MIRFLHIYNRCSLPASGSPSNIAQRARSGVAYTSTYFRTHYLMMLSSLWRSSTEKIIPSRQHIMWAIRTFGCRHNHQSDMRYFRENIYMNIERGKVFEAEGVRCHHKRSAGHSNCCVRLCAKCIELRHSM